MKPRSGRTIPLYFKVSPQEKEIIDNWHSQPAGLLTENGGGRVCGAGGYVRLQGSGVPAA